MTTISTLNGVNGLDIDRRRARPQWRTRGWIATVGMAFLALSAGCGSGVGTGTGTGGGGTVTPPSTKVSVEPNDSFALADVTLLDADGALRVEGMIEQPGDLDVFLLGELNAGDQVVIDTTAAGTNLDVSIALYDDQQRLVYASDDRANAGPRFLDPYIEWVVRHSSDRYYLVVTHSAFAVRGTLAGSYDFEIQVTGGSLVPPPVAQTLFLDFDGADIDSHVLEVSTVVPFDGGAISPIYSGQTQALKDAIRLAFEQNFERFGVTIITSDDGIPIDDTKVSTVHFGGFSESTFGIAEDVDLYNSDFCDDAVIFTETFGTGLFSSPPTASQLGLAIGNIGSHEAGHLLGLNHVDDDTALMDDQSAADAFLMDQEFMTAPVSTDIIPIGVQDAVLLLAEIVGAAPGLTLKESGFISARSVYPTNITGGRWVVRRVGKHHRGLTGGSRGGG